MNNKKLVIPMLGLALLGGVGAGVASLASADSATATTPTVAAQDNHKGRTPGIMGTVSEVKGSTITVTDKKDSTSYTVDASSAKILKQSTAIPRTAPTTVTVSDVTVGDTVMVRGTISGSSVTATEVMDGAFEMRGGRGGRRFDGAFGTVTSISGSTLTITGKDGGVYTVDAQAAKVDKTTNGTKSTGTLSNIAIGDTVMVHGKTITASITADRIVDGIMISPTKSGTSPVSTQ